MNDGRWHIPDPALDAWLNGDIGPADAASVEQHLVSCAACRERTNGAVIDDLDLDEVWYGIVETTAGHLRSPIARAATRLGLTDADGLQLGASQGFRLAWLSGFAVLLLAAVAVSTWHPTRSLDAYLLIAPLLPLLGVSAGFGPHVDPIYELSLATPSSALRSVLLRSAAVLAISTPPMIVVGALLEPWWVGPLVTVPALTFVVTTLAVSTWRPPVQATAIVAATWIAASTVTIYLGDPLVLVRGAAIVVFVLLLIAALVIMVLRRDLFSSPVFTV